MQFHVLGVNHTTAPVTLRERVAIGAQTLQETLQLASQACDLSDIVMLSTCNRTEIYMLTRKPHDMLAWFAEHNQLPVDALQPHIYHYENKHAIQHLMRVSSGLDSMVLGEPQIFGQMKVALNDAQHANTVTPTLLRIFEQSFFVAKKVRSETSVGAHAVSMGFAVVKLAQQLFSDLEQTTALIVATGEMNTLVVKHLCEHGVKRILLCNRTRANAGQLAEDLHTQFGQQLQIEIVDYHDLNDALVRADIVSTCSGSMQPIILKSAVKSALKKRRFAPMLIVDLAVPRDVEADTGELDDVYLYSVDDLQHVIDGNVAQRKVAAHEAESLVDTLLMDYLKQGRKLNAKPHILKYREQAENFRKLELEKALQQLQRGEDPAQILRQMSNGLMAKLVHAPQQLLQESAMHEQPDVLEFVSGQLISKV